LIERKYFDDVKEEKRERARKAQATKENKKRKLVEDGNPSTTNRPSKLLCISFNQGPEDSPLVKLEDASDATQLLAPLHTPSTVPASKRQNSRQQLEIESILDHYINVHLRSPANTTQRICRRQPGNQYFANPAIPQGVHFQLIIIYITLIPCRLASLQNAAVNTVALVAVPLLPPSLSAATSAIQKLRTPWP
jgi:hypothetical protein